MASSLVDVNAVRTVNRDSRFQKTVDTTHMCYLLVLEGLAVDSPH
jgi:hypothetical protein